MDKHCSHFCTIFENMFRPRVGTTVGIGNKQMGEKFPVLHSWWLICNCYQPRTPKAPGPKLLHPLPPSMTANTHPTSFQAALFFPLSQNSISVIAELGQILWKYIFGESIKLRVGSANSNTNMLGLRNLSSLKEPFLETMQVVCTIWWRKML